MKKALSYRLFRLGAIPKKLRPELESEGIVVADEGMAGRFVAKNVKGPGRRYRGRVELFSGCLAVTQKRVACFTYGKRQIHIAADDPKLSDLFVDVPAPDTLLISFEAADFRDDWRGVLAFRFKTQKARRFFDVLTALGAGRGRPASGA
ncbi:hypothetical protein [Desulfosudis oleivorans]|uniref:YokE-like PH domain-containing protein n=1 Tax=Desulfosudis oleivorans (strain DSM 6200 / JCM 39069 / Hxd3) TaxID=96561 RepID=A8ZS10_DESOH|nr:hypothetical protein [Desulfosudis oleivorans]ABW66028.1 hypothetical protein Dole_0218 [Desulfosudis oleivorans Hxd3]